MNRWRFLAVASSLVLIVAVSVFATGQIESGGAMEPVTLKLAHGNGADHPMNQGAEMFAELVEERSGGAVLVDVFPARQLGGNREMFEGVMAGSIDIAIVPVNQPASIDLDLWRILEAGYVFRDQAHAFSFLHSEEMDPLIQEMEDEVGVTIIEPSWYFGVRHLTANKPVRTPADLRGMKIRVPQVPAYLETLQGMGASPTPIDFGELYTALQTGVVEGQENPFVQIYVSKFYEVQDYLMLTGHLVSSNAVFMNADTLNRLSAEQQETIRDAINEAARYQDGLILDSEQDYLERLQDEGMEVIEADRDAFQARVKRHFFDSWFTGLEKQFYDVIQTF